LSGGVAGGLFAVAFHLVGLAEGDGGTAWVRSVSTEPLGAKSSVYPAQCFL